MAKKKQDRLYTDDELKDHPDDKGKLAPGPGQESFKLAAFWKKQVEMVDESQRKWIKRGNSVLKRYRDERNRSDEDTGQRRMNLLWANVKVMKPAIYSKCPTPVVDRKFLDRDPTGRLSSQMLERSLINEMQNDFHSAMTSAVYDRLLPGRGTVWPRYEPTIGYGPSIPANNPDGIEDPLMKIGEETGDEELLQEDKEEIALEVSGEQIISEKVVFDYVNWRDLYLFPAKARVWEEVQAVGKRICISKKEAIDRFGEEIGKKLQPDTTPLTQESTERQSYSDSAIFQDINERSIVVFEIWNKSDQRVYWISTGYQYLCDVKDDPLKLIKFFPIPRPLQATTTTDTVIPVPDYIEWQDQAIQIDELTKRIAMLTKACKVVGAYNAANTSLNTIFSESVENQLIPVDQWAMFAEGGGLKGQIDFVPIDQIQKCIETLQKVRQQCMIDLDQVTGLSDIMRGTSDSRETLGGIRLKNNNAGTRLSDTQEEVARYACEAINIAAEIISKHFDDQTIIDSSGILYEEELQPDVILRAWEAEQAPKPQMPQQGLQMPQQGPQMPQAQLPKPPQNLAMQAPGGPQMPSPQGMPPQLPGQPPQQPHNNIIPFPGGQQTPPQIEQPKPDPAILIVQKVEEAIQLLRKDVTRHYRIAIETDSTIFGDKVQERQDATEFVGAIGQFMQQFEGIANNVPEFMPLAGRMLQWAVRKYRTGRDLESEVDSFVAQMQKKAKAQQDNPQPNPEQIKAQMEQAKSQFEMAKLDKEAQIQQQNDQRDAQIQASNDQRDFQKQQAEDQRQAALTELEVKYEREKMEMEMEFKRQEHALKMRELEMQGAHQTQAHNQKMEQLKVQAAEKEKQRAEAKRKANQPKKKAS